MVSVRLIFSFLKKLKKQFFFTLRLIFKIPLAYFYYLQWPNHESNEEILLTIEFMILDWYSGFRELNFLVSDNLDINFFFKQSPFFYIVQNMEYFFCLYIDILDILDDFCFNKFYDFEDYWIFKTPTYYYFTSFDYIDLDLDGRHYLYMTNFRNLIRESELLVPQFTDSP